MSLMFNKIAFSDDGQYFAFLSGDGKLKIWDTQTGVFKQEYTPKEHLKQPCTSLTWWKQSHVLTSPGKKKKRRGEEEEGATSSNFILLGLKSGNVLLYSLSTGIIEGELPGINSPIKCLTFWKNDIYAGCSNGNIVHWSLPTKTLTSKWRGSRSGITGILATSGCVITATQTITVWDSKTHLELKKFTGHVSPINKLLLIPGGSYIASISQGDRHICVWPLSKDTKSDSIGSFVLPDLPSFVSIGGVEETNMTRLVVITEGGVLHSFYHQINGTKYPPVKPHLTVQIAASSQQDHKSPIDSIPIIGALVKNDDPSYVNIVYGNSVVYRFEKICVGISKDVMWLVRQLSKNSDLANNKVKSSEDVVHYVQSTGIKRPREGELNANQLPIEQRISNLSLDIENAKDPSLSTDSLALVLAQGLKSSDQKLLRTVLLNKNDSVVSNTVARLGPGVIPLLLKELSILVHYRGWKSEAATRWIHALLVHHASLVLASPELQQLLGPLLGLVETRLSQLSSLSRLRGRLSLLLGQIAHSCTVKTSIQQVISQPNEIQAPLLEYHDGEDSSSDEFGLDSDDDTQEDAVNGEVSSEDENGIDEDEDEEMMD